MNLLSPLVPQWSGLFSGLSAWFGATEGPWDENVIDATGGQYEEFQYLGAGVLFLMSIALWLDRKNVAKRVRKYWGLFLAFLILTSLAITHRVYIGGWGIALFDEVPLSLDEIRASGRLFCPVGYAIAAAATATIALRASPYGGAGLLLVATALQAADVTPIRGWVRDGVAQEHAERYVVPPVPTGLVATATHVFMFALLIEVAGLVPLVANIAAFSAAVLVSFVGHFHWTFPHKDDDDTYLRPRASAALVKFAVVALAGFVLNSLAVYAVANVLVLPYAYAMVPTLFVVPVIIVSFSKLWAFAPSPRPSVAEEARRSVRGASRV